MFRLFLSVIAILTFSYYARQQGQPLTVFQTCELWVAAFAAISLDSIASTLKNKAP